MMDHNSLNQAHIYWGISAVYPKNKEVIYYKKHELKVGYTPDIGLFSTRELEVGMRSAFGIHV